MQNMEQLRKFVSPEVVYGLESLNLVKDYVQNYESARVLIVTDEGIIKAGWCGKVADVLEKAGIEYIIFSSVTPNPRAEEVMSGAKVYSDNECDSIVAIGGGSAMDCAKGIGIVISNGQHIKNFEGVDKVPVPMPPLICIPTTAGTASEVSQFSIIMDTQKKNKMAIISKAVIPDIALIDPQVLLTKPAYLTACTGMDALVHAMEAYVSNGSSEFTDLHALYAIKLISNSLAKSVKDLSNLELRYSMMIGSIQAGFAFSNASLGAVHAMAHSLGGELDLPHGECNSLLLEHVVDYNYDYAEEKYKKIAEAMGINTGALTKNECKNALISEIIKIKNEAGITKTLSQIGVKPDMLKKLTENALKDACIITNPRRPVFTDIEEVYEKAL